MSSPLPFMDDKKKIAGVVSEHRFSSEDNHGLLAAMSELMRAMKSEDLKAMAAAFKNASELIDSMPQEGAE